jgi:hypothetical protein
MGSGDVTLDMYGWKNAAAGIDIFIKKRYFFRTDGPKIQ